MNSDSWFFELRFNHMVEKKEKLFAFSKISPEDFKQWIANLRYEGAVELYDSPGDKAQSIGNVQLVFRATYPSFLDKKVFRNHDSDEYVEVLGWL